MSVEDKLHRLVIARDNIRTALEGQGIDASEHGFEDFAGDVGDIENLSDVDVVAFGDNPTLPDKGKTNPANYEAIADAINAARAHPNAVTLESLNVTANGEHTAPSGKAYSSVTVAVPLSVFGWHTSVKNAIVTVGENTVSNITMFCEYLYALAGGTGNITYPYFFFGLIDEVELVNNIIVGSVILGESPAVQAWRYRDGAYGKIQLRSEAYDAVAVPGTKYFVCWIEGDNLA